MLPVSLTTSPQNSLTDMFLDACGNINPSSFFTGPGNRMDNTFSTILHNNLQGVRARNDLTTAPSSSEPSEPVRNNAIDELTRRVEEIGVPLGSMTLNEKDMQRLEKVMTDSGYTSEEVQSIKKRLSEGSLTMDRVLSAVSSVKKQKTSSLNLDAESISLLGKFLQEAGMNPDRVKEALSQLKAGQPFGAKELKDLLLKHGDLNLQVSSLGGVDQDNLNQLLTSLGASDKDMENFQNMMQKTGGKMSLEGLLGFLRSVDRPTALKKDQLKNIDDLVKNLIMNNTLRAQPQFNRIVSLLEAMGDQEIDREFTSNNPAVQALRSGTLASRTLSQGAEGQGASSQSQSNMTGDSGENGFAGLTDTEKSQASAKAAGQTASLSRLSTSVAQQVAEKMVYQARNNLHRMQIQLNPPELGRLDISLVMKQSGLHATIVADTPQGKAALEEQMSQLKSAMAEQGLNLQQFDIALGYENRPSDFSSSRDRSSGSSMGSRKRTDSSAAEQQMTTAEPTPAWNSSRIDRLI